MTRSLALALGPAMRSSETTNRGADEGPDRTISLWWRGARHAPRSPLQGIAAAAKPPIQLRAVPQRIPSRSSHHACVAGWQGAILLWSVPPRMAGHSTSPPARSEEASRSTEWVPWRDPLVPGAARERAHSLGDAIASRKLRQLFSEETASNAPRPKVTFCMTRNSVFIACPPRSAATDKWVTQPAAGPHPTSASRHPYRSTPTS